MFQIRCFVSDSQYMNLFWYFFLFLFSYLSLDKIETWIFDKQRYINGSANVFFSSVSGRSSSFAEKMTLKCCKPLSNKLATSCQDNGPLARQMSPLFQAPRRLGLLAAPSARHTRSEWLSTANGCGDLPDVTRRLLAHLSRTEFFSLAQDIARST